MALAWLCLIAFMLAGYAVLDGYDIGAGMAHLLVARTDEERAQVIASIGPLWDGNEVWLVALGGSLFFAFPLLYAVAFSGFYLELVMVLGGLAVTPQATASAAAPIPPIAEVSNIAAIGQLLYTRYIFFFQMAGMVLLVAMIGAIVLTLRHKENVKRQSIARQVARTPATAVEVMRVESGKGLS